MEVAEAASGGPLENTVEVASSSQEEEVNDGAESAAQAKPRVVRVKRKREQPPLENICNPNSYPFSCCCRLFFASTTIIQFD
jgi:hypothetical protein